MPDGDIFSKAVPRPWVKPSRLAFGKHDFESAMAAAAKVLLHEWTEMDCVALGNSLQAISQAMDSAIEASGRRAFVRNLDWAIDTLPNSYAEALQRVAHRSLLIKGSPIELSDSQGATEEHSISIGVAFISEFIIMNTAPAAKAARLAKDGMTDAVGFIDLVEAFRQYLQGDPGTQALASCLTRTPVSLNERRGMPRVRRPRRSQRELLNVAIG